MYSQSFDIIGVTETWLSTNIFTNEIFPSCYTVLRKDRDSRGGGVLLAFKSFLTVTQLTSPNDLEIVSAEIDPNLLMCLIYRPPNCSDQYNTSLMAHLNSVDSTQNIVLLGDLNFPDIDWSIYSGSSPTADDFAEVIFGLNLIQCITGPTHRAGNTLDIALSNINGLQYIETCTNLPPNLSSDHYLIKLLINHVLSIPTKICIQRLDYNKVNWEDMNQFLIEYDFTLALNSKNVEFIWLYLKTAINSALNLYVPKISIKESNHPKWFNPTIRHKIKCLRTAKRQLVRHPTERKRLKVEDLQRELQQMITEAKHDYETNLALNYAHINSNKIFKYISSIKGRESFPAKMYHINESASTDLEKAQLFNNYFHSVFSTFTGSTSSVSDLQSSSVTPHVQDILFSDSDVLDLLISLDKTKACGIDSFSPKIFKHCAGPLLHIICHLFQTSISCSFIPLDWRTHCVVPVYKSGDKSSVSNYRPISLLCILSKVLERIVYNNIINHVREQSTKHQFGFLPRRSTLQQLLVFAEKVFEPNKCEVDVVYMDFKKAFDSVSHHHLLGKLQTFGITGKARQWFEAYLHNRYQCVKIGDLLSELCYVHSGVPQGSVL